jgi:K+-sensing histidine kinase KdpD
VRVRVDNDGDGMATIEVANSTAPQHQAVDGHGIGLTVVTAAVAAHGGTIAREDDDPDRVIVRVHLPVGDATTDAELVSSSAFVTDRA